MSINPHAFRRDHTTIATGPRVNQPFTALKSLAAALLLALSVSVLAAAPASAAEFNDVPSKHQFYKEISWLASTGITTGYSDHNFYPSRTVSREAFAAFLYRLDGKPAVTLPSRSPFKDMKLGDQFYREVVWLEQSGIADGFADGTFRPEASISRAAIAAFLYRYEGRPTYKTPKSSPFKDMKTSDQFFKEVSWLEDSGLTTGYADKTFRPNNGTSRAAMAAFLYRGYHTTYTPPAPSLNWVGYHCNGADMITYRGSSGWTYVSAKADSQSKGCTGFQ